MRMATWSLGFEPQGATFREQGTQERLQLESSQRSLAQVSFHFQNPECRTKLETHPTGATRIVIPNFNEKTS